MHRRSCTVTKSVCDEINSGESERRVLGEEEDLRTSGGAGNDELELLNNDGAIVQNPISRPMLPCVKLPRSKQKWEGANIFFKINLPIHPVEPVIDVNACALNMQQTINNYFASTEGIVKKYNNQLHNKCKSFTVKQLKRELRMLKSNKHKGDEIIFVSKLIRKRI